jgi:hypothetical protein
VSDDEEDGAGWSLRNEDRGLLNRVAQALPGLAPLAQCGNDLIALGEAWDAIEQIIESRTIEVDVELSVGFRRCDERVRSRGSADQTCASLDKIRLEEGLFMGLRVNNEEIILDELNTTYSSDVGSDHFTRVYASLGPSGGFDSVGVEEWLVKLEEVQSFDDAELSTERDHV